MNWEENREWVVSLHIFNSRKIPGPKKRELGGHTVLSFLNLHFLKKVLLEVRSDISIDDLCFEKCYFDNNGY